MKMGSRSFSMTIGWWGLWMSTILDLTKNLYGFPTAHEWTGTPVSKPIGFWGVPNMYRSTRGTCFRKPWNGLFSRNLKVALVMNGGVARMTLTSVLGDDHCSFLLKWEDCPSMNGNSKRDTGDWNRWDLVPPLKKIREVRLFNWDSLKTWHLIYWDKTNIYYIRYFKNFKIIQWNIGIWYYFLKTDRTSENFKTTRKFDVHFFGPRHVEAPAPEPDVPVIGLPSIAEARVSSLPERFFRDSLNEISWDFGISWDYSWINWIECDFDRISWDLDGSMIGLNGIQWNFMA